MDESKFKKLYKNAACTERPWKFLIPKDKKHEVLAQVKRECLAIYGYDFEECSKRKICLTKTCLGRELEWKSPTARPYLEQFAKLHNIPIETEYFIKNCDTCPIAKTCKYACAQVNDYVNRDKHSEPELIYRESLDNVVSQPQRNVINRLLPNLNLKWDCLPQKKQSIIKKYIFEQKDFLTIAQELQLNNQARVKYEFYYALTRLAEYSSMVEFLKTNKQQLTQTQESYITLIYSKNFTVKQVAELNKISSRAVKKVISKVVKDFNVKWPVFVRKEKNKVIYNVPEVLNG